MHKISNNWSLNGSKKEKKENRKDKDKEQGGKIWNKIFELSRGNGRLDRGNFKDKNKSNKDRKVN